MVYVHTKDEQIMQLNINQSNYKESIYKDIVTLFTKMVSKINYSELSIDELITTPNQMLR